MSCLVNTLRPEDMHMCQQNGIISKHASLGWSVVQRNDICNILLIINMHLRATNKENADKWYSWQDVKYSQNTYCILVLYYVEWKTWYIIEPWWTNTGCLTIKICVDAQWSICISVIELPCCDKNIDVEGDDNSIRYMLKIYHLSET